MGNQPIVILATAWGPRFGGINAFNDDFSRALGNRLKDSRPVFCVVPKASSSEIDAVNSAQAGLHLIATGAKELDSGDVVMSLRDHGIEQAAWVIGHDVKTGDMALKVSRLLGAKAALIHHMDYKSYGGYKLTNGAETIQRHDEQRELFSKADLCFAVGPLLRDSLNGMLEDDKLANMLVPGLPDIPLVPITKKRHDFTAVVFGRMDLDDEPIKQGRLAVAGLVEAVKWAANNPGASSLLRGKRPNVNIIGIEQSGGETEQRLNELVQTRGDGMIAQVLAEPFQEDRPKLFAKLARANLALMPSWHEGFGLTGWEAIAAGVPLILSTQSGLWQLIDEEAGALQSSVIPVSVKGLYQAGANGEHFTEDDVNAVSLAIRTLAGDFDKAVKRAEELRAALKARFTWAATADSVVVALGLNDPPPAAPPPTGSASKGTSSGPEVEKPLLTSRSSPLSAGSNVFESLLLRPESQVVPFHGPLQQLSREIAEWAMDAKTDPRKVSMRLYTAEGGSGKTRLMIETCAWLREQATPSWAAGFVAERSKPDDLRKRLSTLIAQNVTGAKGRVVRLGSGL